MRSPKIAVAIPLEDELLEPFHIWGKNFDFSHVESVHFIHVVKKNITPIEFGLVENPDDGTYQQMVPALENFLRDEARKILPQDYLGRVEFTVSLDFQPQEEILAVLRKIKADLVVVATRGKHGLDGLFHSSFTEHMVKFAPCDVFVVRPEAEVPHYQGLSDDQLSI